MHLDVYLAELIYLILFFQCGSRGLVLCVQGYFLKHLLFDREYKTESMLGSALVFLNVIEIKKIKFSEFSFTHKLFSFLCYIFI